MNSSGMTDCKFSIIIPVYKVEKYLRQCVDSVLQQSFSDYELILVDDGSPDRCPAICDDLASECERIKVIHKPNGGLSDARNAGLDIANGEYICFLDSDDWWDDCKILEKIIANLQESNADIAILGIKKFYTKTGKIGEMRIPESYNATKVEPSNISLIQRYMMNNAIVASACDKVVKKSFIDRDGQRFVKGQLSEDIEWCAKLLLKNPNISIMETAPYIYRQQVATSISANVGVKNISHILDVIKRYAKTDADEPLLHFLANQYVLLITNLMRVPAVERIQFESDIKSYWWLLNFNWYPYVRKVNRFKFLGFDMVKSLLRAYYLLIK